MANKSTITYNGKVIAETEEAGNVVVTYGGKTIANMGAGETKTFACADKIMKTNLYIGAKTLLCEMAQMISDVIVAVKSAFPEPPSSYVLIGKYTSNQTWTAPEDGYFQIEVFGASGKGGNCANNKYSSTSYAVAQGGGGGGGGYACSRVKLKKGDTISIVRGAVGATSSATINSSVESYSQMKVTSGGNGVAGVIDVSAKPGSAGSGGSASGGNYENKNGGKGTAGEAYSIFKNDTSYTVPNGGSSGHSGGNKGGNGGYGYFSGTTFTTKSGGAGSKGFIKIYRGDTNVVA